MALRLTIKDPLRESRLVMGRSIIAMIVSVLLLAVVVGRLVYLQIIAHDHFRTLSHDNRVRIVPIPPNRGLIYDRNGVLLAENVPSYRLAVTPEQVTDMEKTLSVLARIIEIQPADLERFERLRKRMRSFDSVPLRFRLTEEEVARFAVDRHRFPGVEVIAGPARYYPLGSHAAHVLGYVGRIDERELQTLDTVNYRGTTHVGKTGVEKYYEETLHGSVGYEQVETNARGRVLRVLQRRQPVPGRDLYLSLDSGLQAAAESAFGDYKGAAIAMDPRSGAILAMVSLPGFDPNPFVNGIDYSAYQALQSGHDQPLFNRALRGQYPPGSTLKPFIGLAGLELEVVSADARTFCPGYYSLPGNDRKYRDWKRWGHHAVDLVSAITESCDVYFYDLALSLGIDRIHAALAPFGFGSRTGVDLSGELPGLLPSREWKRQQKNEPWFPGETLITGIGQGFNLVTPLQLASATSTLAMRGRRLRPTTLHATADGTDGGLFPKAPELLEGVPVVDARNWDTIIDAMEKVVHSARGTANRIGEDAGYRIAGKTGTAQVFGLKQEEEYDAAELEQRLRDHALFIAFAPIDDPRIALAVVIENGGSGGAVAAPVARRIMDYYLEHETR